MALELACAWQRANSPLLGPGVWGRFRSEVFVSRRRTVTVTVKLPVPWEHFFPRLDAPQPTSEELKRQTDELHEELERWIKPMVSRVALLTGFDPRLAEWIVMVDD